MPDDAGLVLPHMAIMAADARGEAKLRKRAEQQMKRARAR